MKWALLLAAITALVLSGCNRNKEPEGTVFVSGRIDGDTVEISSKIPGRIVNLAVREGDSVEAGQVVAWLSSPQQEAIRDTQRARIVSSQRIVDQLQRDLATYDEKIKQAELYTKQAQMDAPGQVQQAEANVAVSKAELARWEEELEQAQMEAKRYPPLAKTGAVAVQLSEQFQTKEQLALASVEAARKQVAAAEAALQRARAQLQNIPIQEANRQTLLRQRDAHKEQIASAQATVEADRAALRKIEADIADLTIHAPIAGTILTRSAEPGRVIQPGQTMLTMVDLSKLYLRGFVPQGEIGKVKVGQQAQVYLDSTPNEPVPAEVIRIDPQVMFTPENTYFKEDRVKQVMGLKLGLRGAYGFAKPGMPADGRIQVQAVPPKG
ncbi:MAG TPA: efflux RND transporter periplasmic adaptor subunit [Bryobacteraceae bacterium]|nr:efflux RND transporter periplasmic adaptor subunit [Bryobacteraceae bacterium]